MNINAFFEMLTTFWNSSFIDFGDHGVVSVRLAALLVFLAIASAAFTVGFLEENPWSEVLGGLAAFIVGWFVVFGLLLAKASANGSIYSAQAVQQKTVVVDGDAVSPPQ